MENIKAQINNDLSNQFFEGIPNKGDVLLLGSPTAWTGGPLLSLHSVQAACRKAGITAHVLYLNLLYSDIIGRMLHSKIAFEDYLFLEDRLFASAAFNIPALAGCKERFLNPSWMPDHVLKVKTDQAHSHVLNILTPFRKWFGTVDWEHLESLTISWVQSTAQRIANLGYGVIGCSTTFGSMVPAIALFNEIKKANGNSVTVLGGALCEGEMAEGILSLEAGIDYIFSGESEITFPDFVKQVSAEQLPREKIIYGEQVKNLDTIPPPDFREYFEQINKLTADRPSPGRYGLPYQAGRGCWYGKCTFCGHNGKDNYYRIKSPARVCADLKEITAEHTIDTIFMVDNIMPPDFFDVLLPQISKELPHLDLHHDIKPNLTLEQVISLKNAGVTSVITGIESLSPSLMRQMRKGVSARENITFLRYARSAQITLNWLLMYGFPGDRIGWYEEMTRLFPLIHHLNPPLRMFSLMICRFSPYYTYPEAFGISGLRPAESYRDIFPPHAHLEKLACYFSCEFPAQSREYPETIVALVEEFTAWKQSWETYNKIPLDMMRPTLHITRKTRDEYVLEDTRGLPGRPERMILDREQAGTLLVPRRQHAAGDCLWAVEARLGVLMESWYIPLATADPELLLEFEHSIGETRA